MDNAELAALLTEGAEALEGIETALATMVKLKSRREEHAIAGDLVRHAQPFAASWPWTPNTVSQGFLAGRWLRRDGNVYAGAALRGIKGPNSPIRGGDDANARVDVPSGAPRAP